MSLFYLITLFLLSIQISEASKAIDEEVFCLEKVRAAHQYTQKNFVYRSDLENNNAKDYWALSSELASKKQGDCEDFALYVFEYALTNNCGKFIDLVYLKSNNPKKQKFDHLNFSFSRHNGKEIYFDHSLKTELDKDQYIAHFKNIHLTPVSKFNLSGTKLFDTPSRPATIPKDFSNWKTRLFNQLSTNENHRFNELNKAL